LLDSLLQEIVENEGKVAQEEGSQAEEEKEEDEAEVQVNFRLRRPWSHLQRC